MVCEPRVVEEKLYVAEPFERAREEVSVVKSTTMVKVPVGVVVVELDAEVTVIEMGLACSGIARVIGRVDVIDGGNVLWRQKVMPGLAGAKVGGGGALSCIESDARVCPECGKTLDGLYQRGEGGGHGDV